MEIRETDRQPLDQLHYAAQRAQIVLQRVAGEGSVLEQIGNGEWDSGLSEAAAVDLTDQLLATAEIVRRIRATAGQDIQRDESLERSAAIEMLASGLPLNRKERYYTGTVLPMIVAADDFAHLHRFLMLCGMPADALPTNSDSRTSPRLQFFTEYSFVESVFTDTDRARFHDVPTSNDTPDVVLVGDDWLLAVEAKMFHDPSPQALNAQLDRQRIIVDYIAVNLHIPAARTRHVVLLPAPFAANALHAPVVTWEDVLHAYRVVGPEYWVATLSAAISRYHDLVSRAPAFGRNSEAIMTGADILAAHASGTLDFTYMGRSRGIEGSPISDDIKTGAWRTRHYEVRRDPLETPNWFPIADFIARTANP